MKRVGLFFCAIFALAACDNDDMTDAGTDAGNGMMDAGPGMVDAGPGMTDAGPGMTDAGPGMTDAGPGDTDAGVDSGAGDAGCTRDTCMAGECGIGVRDDGCGTPLDCGACAAGGPCLDETGCMGDTCISEVTNGWRDGYCSDGCRRDTDCGTGEHCGFIDDITRLGVCLVNCTADADCRMPDYSCVDPDEDTVTECAAHATGLGVVGDACSAASDCSGTTEGGCLLESQGFRRGYCTLNCTADADCGTGAHCIFQDATTMEGVCALDCTADTDCRIDGYQCFDADMDTGTATECWPAGTGSGAPGAACEGLWVCGGGTDGRCVDDDAGFLDGMCFTAGCTTTADCATGSHCGDFGQPGAPFNVCLDDCTADADCRTGYACFDANGDGASECFPAGTGTGMVGDACEGVWDCAGRERGVCLERPNNNFLDGYCAVNGCTLGGTGMMGCPTGSHCSIFGGAAQGFCVDDCTVDTDCRGTGYQCYDGGDDDTAFECLPAATGTGMVGDECRFSEDCAGDEFGFCVLFGDPMGTPPVAHRVGGYCSIGCGTGGTTCPTGSTCVDVLPTAPGGDICLDDCAVAGDCRMPDYTCQPDGMGGNVCDIMP